MGIQRVEETITVDTSLDEAWEFFATPNNLARLTPPKMNMRMIDGMAGKMYPGMVIRYRVSPLFGISLPWSSEITQVNEKEYFVDNMIEGPFKTWHHQHRFSEGPEGVEIRDIVHYQVPLGKLGELFAPLLVKQNIEEIFAYRRKQVEKIFGKNNEA